jgi:aryl-alcohol dehydrogenase-like predicted oxidoreductase
LQRRQIGSLEVTVVGIGCDNFGGRMGEAHTQEVVNAALDAGVNFFDTADVYPVVPPGLFTRSEELMGRALKGRRDEAVIATKFGARIDDGHPGGARPEYIRTALEASLSRLATDRIDLYQLHSPDPDTPISDTLGALGELVEAGKIIEIGCSNFSVEQLRQANEALSPGRPGFVSVQNEYSLLVRKDELDVLPECERTGLAYLPYFPLYNGLLTGKYRRGADRPSGTRLTTTSAEQQARVFSRHNLDVVEALITFAEQRGHTILELAFARLLAHPALASVIAGATSAGQVAANVAASSWCLTPEEIAEMDSIAPLS